MSQFAIRWIFVLDEDYVYNLQHHLPPDWDDGFAFVDDNGHRRLEIHPNGDARVLASYAWDGCTPKFSVFDIVTTKMPGDFGRCTGGGTDDCR